jgi:hypothetical protein
MIMRRTHIVARPDQFKKSIGYETMMKRRLHCRVSRCFFGRWMSDGLYDNMRAFILIKSKKDVDEASILDTIDWLVKDAMTTINGNVGVWEFHIWVYSTSCEVLH